MARLLTEKPKKNVLVIGGGGYLGSGVTKYLEDRSYVTFSKSSRIISNQQVPLVIQRCLDDGKPEHLASHLRMLRIGAIINAAGVPREKCISNPSLAAKVNLKWVRTLYRSANLAKVKTLIHFSTIHVFNSNVSRIEEKLPDRSQQGGDEYARSKAAAERFLHSQHKRELNLFILRLSNVFGHTPNFEKGTHLFLNSLLNNALSQKEVKVRDVGAYRSILSVSKLCELIEKALDVDQKSSGMIYNCGSMEFLGISSIASQITNIFKNPRFSVSFTKSNRVFVNLQCSKLLSANRLVPTLMVKEEVKHIRKVELPK